jgi:hypothetical protein
VALRIILRSLKFIPIESMFLMALSHVFFNEASQEELDAINFIKETNL